MFTGHLCRITSTSEVEEGWVGGANWNYRITTEDLPICLGSCGARHCGSSIVILSSHTI